VRGSASVNGLISGAVPKPHDLGRRLSLPDKGFPFELLEQIAQAACQEPAEASLRRQLCPLSARRGP